MAQISETKFNMILAAITLMGSVFLGALGFSFASGKGVQEITSSIQQVKTELADVNISLREIRKDSIELKVQNSSTITKLDALDKRVEKLENKVNR